MRPPRHGAGQGVPVVNFDQSGLVLDDYEYEEAIREGVLAACARGIVQGYPVVDVGVTILGVDKQPDTSPSATAMCASEATRRLLTDAAVTMLQPIMSIEVVTSGEHVGNVLTDLSAARQANVLGVDILPDTNQLVQAEVQYICPRTRMRTANYRATPRPQWGRGIHVSPQ